MLTSRIAVCLCVLALLSCRESSPTAPFTQGPQRVTTQGLHGDWRGFLSLQPEGEDWRGTVLSIDASRPAITGQIVPRIGPSRAITGEIHSQGATIFIQGLPETECQGVSLVVEAIEYRNNQPYKLVGHLSGRCPDPLSHVLLTRAPS
jgi:hypothetical protein